MTNLATNTQGFGEGNWNVYGVRQSGRLSREVVDNVNV